jgi:hypothetical protein
MNGVSGADGAQSRYPDGRSRREGGLREQSDGFVIEGRIATRRASRDNVAA